MKLLLVITVLFFVFNTSQGEVYFQPANVQSRFFWDWFRRPTTKPPVRIIVEKNCKDDKKTEWEQSADNETNKYRENNGNILSTLLSSFLKPSSFEPVDESVKPSNTRLDDEEVSGRVSFFENDENNKRSDAFLKKAENKLKDLIKKIPHSSNANVKVSQGNKKRRPKLSAQLNGLNDFLKQALNRLKLHSKNVMFISSNRPEVTASWINLNDVLNETVNRLKNVYKTKQPVPNTSPKVSARLTDLSEFEQRFLFGLPNIFKKNQDASTKKGSIIPSRFGTSLCKLKAKLTGKGTKELQKCTDSETNKPGPAKTDPEQLILNNSLQINQK